MRPQDRRRHPRVPADAFSFLSAQLVSGGRVKLLDVSHGGVRLETATHVRPGQTLDVHFTIGDEVVAATALVIRATVTSLASDHVCYETALQLLEDENREQFQLALASRGRDAQAAEPEAGRPRPPGLDIVLIAEPAGEPTGDWWLASGDGASRPAAELTKGMAASADLPGLKR